jgi:hypothetical protein
MGAVETETFRQFAQGLTWIGATDPDNNRSTAIWDDGVLLSTSFAPWLPGEPNSPAGTAMDIWLSGGSYGIGDYLWYGTRAVYCQMLPRESLSSLFLSGSRNVT